MPTLLIAAPPSPPPPSPSPPSPQAHSPPSAPLSAVDQLAGLIGSFDVKVLAAAGGGALLLLCCCCCLLCRRRAAGRWAARKDGNRVSPGRREDSSTLVFDDIGAVAAGSKRGDAWAQAQLGSAAAGLPPRPPGIAGTREWQQEARRLERLTGRKGSVASQVVSQGAARRGLISGDDVAIALDESSHKGRPAPPPLVAGLSKHNSRGSSGTRPARPRPRPASFPRGEPAARACRRLSLHPSPFLAVA